MNIYSISLTLLIIFQPYAVFAQVSNDNGNLNQYQLSCVSEVDIPSVFKNRNLERYYYRNPSKFDRGIILIVGLIIGENSKQLLAGKLVDQRGRYLTHDPLKRVLADNSNNSDNKLFFVKSVEWNCQLRRNSKLKPPIGKIK